jgi:hypothetical protein
VKTTIEVNDFVWSTEVPITHADYGFFDSDVLDSGTLIHLRSMVFKAFYNLARPIMEMHGGDLYHDANWLNENLKPENANGFVCFFSVRKYGTIVAAEKDGTVYAEHNEFTYKITLGHDGKRWVVVSELVSCNG